MSRYLVAVISLLLILITSEQLSAQGIAAPRIEFSAGLTDTSAKADTFSNLPKFKIDVRPNADEQALFVMVKNISDSSKSYFITASLNDKKIIAHATVKELAPQAVEVVQLKPVGELPKAKDAKAEEAKSVTAGRPITAQDTIVFKAYHTEADSNNTNAKPVVFTVTGSIRSPESFLEVEPEVGSNEAPYLGKLKVVVKHTNKDNQGGPPCKVELDLSNLTGLSPDSLKDATLQAELSAEMDQVILSVNDARLAPGVSELGGFFAITVDGYRRAFMYTTGLKPGTKPQKVQGNNLVRVKIDRGNLLGGSANTVYIKPNKDQKIVARLEVDNPTNDIRLEYGLFGDERPEPNVYQKRIFPASRDQKLTFQMGKQETDGTLRFAATLQDFEMYLNTVEGTTGKRVIKLSVLNKDNSIARSFDLPVVFDPNPPTITKFDVSTTTPKVGSKVKLSVEATSLSTIEKAYFFLGDPPANNAATNKWVPGKLVSGRYEAELQLPPNQKGPVPLGVRVIGGNGEKMDQSREVVAMEPPPPETSVGKVRVTVVQYVTDDPQSEMPVVLRNEKNEVLSTAKTDKKGEVLFEKLKPGKYEVGSVKAFDRSAGVSKVEIKPDEEAKVTIRLKRVR